MIIIQTFIFYYQERKCSRGFMMIISMHDAPLNLILFLIFILSSCWHRECVKSLLKATFWILITYWFNPVLNYRMYLRRASFFSFSRRTVLDYINKFSAYELDVWFCICFFYLKSILDLKVILTYKSLLPSAGNRNK